MRVFSILPVLLAVVAIPVHGEETTLKTAIAGDTLSINGQPTKLGKAQWEMPEQSWRTIGEHIKTAVPPADANGKRADVTLLVSLDGTAPWGALKALCMAAAGLGIPKAKILLPGKTGKKISFSLPGADSTIGSVVAFPLSTDAKGTLMTENNKKNIACTVELMQGLVKQQPKATIHVSAGNTLPAYQVAKVLSGLENEAQAAAVAYLPLKELDQKETDEHKKVKDAVDRAFGGALGGALGGDE